MEIYGIIGRYKNEFRLEVKATESMNQGWLEVLNEDCNENEKYKSFEEAMNEPYQCYLSNDEGFLVMEVIRDLDKDDYYVEYFFDDYEYINADLTDEEIKEIDYFIEKHKDDVEDKMLIRKDLAEQMLQREDLDSYSKKEWEKELSIVSDKLIRLDRR